ncbi:hypothetical protein MMC10_003282 [Thelotrema lepadinum]|nr:hypothetical protein [Thelotrema lepadinum]
MDWLCRTSGRGRIGHEGPPLTLRTLLVAMVKAYEIQGCFQICNAFNGHGLDHIILVKLASTAVVTWLMGMSREQAMAAISHVWMDGAALRTYRSGVNTIPRKNWAAGDACARAVQFALLTRTGQAGAKTVLTMPRWGFYDAIWQGRRFILPQKFGTWSIENIFYKVVPVEGHSISAIEASLVQHEKLRIKHKAEERHIARVNVRTNAAANLIINKGGELHNAADRDHCMQYAVAVTLLKGTPPVPEDFQDSSPFAASPAIEALRERIHVREDENFTRDYLDVQKKSVASAISISLCDGTELSEVVVEYPVGHVRHTKTPMEVRKKFNRNMALMFTEPEIQKIIQTVEREDELQISRLVDLFARPPVDRQSSPKL